MKNKIISIIAALIITLPLAAQVKKGKTTKTAPQPVVKEVLDRSIRPQAGPAPVIKIGDYQSFELANGLKVFSTKNIKQGWNGYIGSRLAPSGTYSWTATGVYPNGKTFSLKGTVSVISQEFE